MLGFAAGCRSACLTALLAAAAWGVAPTADAARPPGGSKPGKKYALLVGVDRYGRGALLPALQYPQNDVDDLAAVLIDSGFAAEDVVVMTRKTGFEQPDLTPNAENIRRQFSLMVKLLEPRDTIIVMLSGHGVMMEVSPAAEGGKPVKKSFFCPTDADLGKRDLSRLIGFDEFFDGFKLGDEAVEGLAQCKATSKLLLIDGCRNELRASKPEARAPGIEMPPPPAPPASVAAFYSCSEKELAWEDSTLGQGHGVFSHFLIEGLKGAADRETGDKDNAVDLDELALYVKKNVYRFVSQRRGTSQQPRMLGDTGRMVLRELKDVAKPARPSFVESIGMTIVPIKAGEFLMGTSDEQVTQMLALFPNARPSEFSAEQPRHRVSISKIDGMAKHEVTVGQFRRFVDDSGYKTEAEKDGKGGYGFEEGGFRQDPKFTWHHPGFPIRDSDDHPVTNVSWNDANEFCRWLSRKDGKSFRLPTEAEWEYCARAGSDSLYEFGDDPEGLARAGNVADASARTRFPDWPSIRADDGFAFTAPVGQFAPNAWGLCDMHGNLWEWCLDNYDAAYYQKREARDPAGPGGRVSHRVLRGGNWYRDGKDCRAAVRNGDAPESRDLSMGFRVARARPGG